MTVRRRLTALMLAAIFLALLTGCGGAKLKGTYAVSGDLFGLAGGSVRYTFAGAKVTVAVEGSVLGFSNMAEYTGSYQIHTKENTITFTFDSPEANDYAGTYRFRQGEHFIEIDGVTYQKEA